MKYRLLEPEEWGKLGKMFEIYKQTPPPPELATVAVAEDDNGELAGCLVLQLVLHMEPLVIQNPRANFLRLQAVLEKSLSDGLRELAPDEKVEYYCFSETEKVSRMAELMGLQKMPYKIWRKEVH